MQLIVILLLVVAVALRFRNKGKAGERNVAYRLHGLPDEYKVINNLQLSFGNWTSQIDHVVVSPYGVFVIETKNYTGIITGGENSAEWTKNMYGNKYSFHNPVFQNESHVKAIRKCLGDYGSLRIIPIIAFSNEADVRVKLESKMVVYFSQLKRTIRAYNEVCIPDAQVTEIYNKLLQANVEDRSFKREHVKEAKRQQVKTEQKIRDGICPRCGAELVERHGQYGRFWGCSNYPKCKFTVN
ncbi:MAG: NERD domain-containing protein [Bacteroidaceae bacterium]|nr:NERD domain-containing protein [Bacteroidaceae bacterium]